MSRQAEERAFEAALARFPLTQAVQGNTALADALGASRRRDMGVIGSVVDYDRARLRLGVNWAADRHVEYLAPKYLEPVEMAE